MRDILSKHLRLLVLVLLTLSLVNCATNPTPFEEGKQVEVQGGFWTRCYKQNGKTLSYTTVIDGLKGYDSSEARAKVAEAWWYSGIVSGALGGAFEGYYLFDFSDSGSTRSTGFLIGGVLIGVGILFAYFGDKALVEGVQIYDDEAKYRKSAFHLQPILEVTSLGYGNPSVPYLGLKVTAF